MSKVEEIKAQIEALSWEERCELNALLQNWPEDDWDKQMASDGKFDRVMDEAEREYRAGKAASGRVLKSFTTSGFWKHYHNLAEAA
jgi:hypothetical protein